LSRTYCHPDGEADEGQDGQLEDEVDIDHHRYGRHEWQPRSHKEQGLPKTEAGYSEFGEDGNKKKKKGKVA
jgi:hypothetical protein